MTELWLPFCIKAPGPDWKTGYAGYQYVDPTWIEGTVDHSMEGSMSSALGVLMGPRQTSWTFSIPKVGPPHQHYCIRMIPWQAGLAGDRRTDTSLVGNITLRGKEHEGRAGDPWTDTQIYWSAKIDVAMRELCPRFAANPPTLRVNQWEHRWLSNTSCPSGRNAWVRKFALMRELEEEMALSADDRKEVLFIARAETLRLLREANFGYASGGALKGSLTVLEAIRALEDGLAAHEDRPHGGGLSIEGIKALIEKGRISIPD